MSPLSSAQTLIRPHLPPHLRIMVGARQGKDPFNIQEREERLRITKIS